MDKPKNWWNLSENSSLEEIKVEYKRRVQKMHPDRAGNTPEVLSAFLILQEEYTLLKQYVVFIQNQPKPSIPKLTEKQVMDNQQYDELATNIETVADVPFQTIYHGGVIEMMLKVGEPCVCTLAKDCLSCKGTHQVFKDVRVTIRIPIGTADGSVIRATGKGNKGRHSTGDLLVIVRWVKTHGWSFNGRYLINEMYVPQWLFQSGQSIRVVSPNGLSLDTIMPPVPSHKNKVNISIPQTGFAATDGSMGRGPVGYIVKKAPWYCPWKGWLLQVKAKSKK